MTTAEIALIFSGVINVVLAIALIVVIARKAKNKNKTQVDKIDVIDGVRYTKTAQTLDEKGATMVTLNKGDVILERGKIYTVGKGGLLPGKYTILSGDGAKTFNMRVGGIVKEYSHLSNIVLAEGEKISAVSHNVVLR